MKKKIIAIDINEVIRAHWISVEQYYNRFTANAGEVITPYNTYEYLNHFKFKEKLVDVKYLKENPKEVPAEWYHTKNENGEVKADIHIFDKKQELLTPQAQLNKFLYEDYLLEVFGWCGKVYSSVPTDIEEIYRKNQENYIVKIVSLEEHNSIPATLFFLSKIGMHMSDYSFYGDPNRLWRECDICIAANPKILNSKPSNKFSIKVSREFNESCNADKSIINVNELVDVDFKKYTHKSILNKLLGK